MESYRIVGVVSVGRNHERVRVRHWRDGDQGRAGRHGDRRTRPGEGQDQDATSRHAGRYRRTAVEVVSEAGWQGPVGCGFPAVVKDGVLQTAANVDRAAIGFDLRTALHEEPTRR